MNRGDLLVGLVSLGLGLAALLSLPLAVRGATLMDLGNMRSPAFFPILASLLLVGLGTIQLLLALKTAPATTVILAQPLRMLAVVLVLGGFGLGLSRLGMFSSSMVAVALLALVFGERRWWMVMLLAALVPLAVYLLFERYLMILFPRGLWF